jgi:hypothetical protein
MADDDYRGLASSAASLMALSLEAQGVRAWVNTGVSQLHCWLDALQGAGFGGSTTVAWDYGLATADTAWGSWQSPSAPHLRYSFEPVVCAWGDEWRRIPPAGMERWRDELGNWPALCRNVWRIPPGASAGGEHPAVMPVGLAARAIRLSTWPGEAVLDPFAGTGTTLVAARRPSGSNGGPSVSRSRSATTSWRPNGWPRGASISPFDVPRCVPTSSPGRTYKRIRGWGHIWGHWRGHRRRTLRP